MRMNRAYVKRLENLIIRLDGTLCDLDSERATANLERDMPMLRKLADAIRDSRRAMEKPKLKSESNNCRG